MKSHMKPLYYKKFPPPAGEESQDFFQYRLKVLFIFRSMSPCAHPPRSILYRIPLLAGWCTHFDDLAICFYLLPVGRQHRDSDVFENVDASRCRPREVATHRGASARHSFVTGTKTLQVSVAASATPPPKTSSTCFSAPRPNHFGMLALINFCQQEDLAGICTLRTCTHPTDKTP